MLDRQGAAYHSRSYIARVYLNYIKTVRLMPAYVQILNQKREEEDMASTRYDRISEEIKKGISEIIRELKDPRVSDMTTIMSAEATSDLTLCKVRVSVYSDDDSKREECVLALNHASGFIARELRRRIDIRRVPKLKFELDDTIEYSVHIAGILNTLDIKPETEEQDEPE